MHILSLVTDKIPSWIRGKRMEIAENISWSISTKVWGRARIEPTTPESKIWLATNCAMGPIKCCLLQKIVRTCLTLYLLVSSADIKLCKQFGPRSGPTEGRPDLDPNFWHSDCIHEIIFWKSWLRKISADDKKAGKISRGQRVNNLSFHRDKGLSYHIARLPAKFGQDWCNKDIDITNVMLLTSKDNWPSGKVWSRLV